jgi:hypothetical protein
LRTSRWHGEPISAKLSALDASKRQPVSTHAVWPTEGTLPLSVAVVCKDAKCTIGRTIRSVRGLAREVVVLDSGSTDGTVQLLHRMGINAQHQNWLGYIAQKNCVLGMCRQDWVLCLDSDESLEPDLGAAVERAVLENDARVGGYMMNRKVHYKGAWLDHAWQPEWRLRLVRRGAAKWVGYDPHDELVLAEGSGLRVDRLEGVMRHDSIESIADFLAKQCRHGRTAAAALHKRGKRGSVASLITSPVGAWLKQMVGRSAWRDGWRGWLAASAAAAAALAKHAALLEIERAPHDGPSASKAGAVDDPFATRSGHDSKAGHDSETQGGQGHA